MNAATLPQQETKPEIDTTPEIHYKEGIAVKVTTHCLVNGYSLASSEYRITDQGFLESNFDEHHGINNCKIVPRSRLERLEKANPKFLSALRVLGSDRQSVMEYLVQEDIRAKQIGR